MTVPRSIRFLVRPFLTLTSVVFSLLALSAQAAPTTFKLGTLVPVGTSYHKTLMTLGETWNRESNGSVALRIYAGGKSGGEAEMVALMMANNLQAALLTAVGLAEIDRSVTSLQYIPMGFHTLDELDYVSDRLQGDLEERLRKKGFIVLFWTDAGWIRIFSKKPVSFPDDLRKQKVFSWSGEPEQRAVETLAGFQPIPLETADIVPGLQTGLIEAVSLPPFFALASQVDTRASYMLDLNWAPIVGACVVWKNAWEKLSPEQQKTLMESARKAGQEIKAAARRESIESVAAMQKRGLKVTAVTPVIEKEWLKMSESVYPELRGKVVPAEIFDRTMSLLSEYRSKNAR
jgi:TRAP-type C4-dicarboxylate transport system substrate-binding protein